MNEELAEELYSVARDWMEERWPDELRRARSRNCETFTTMSAEEFLENYCWVVYASGFKVDTLRKLFPKLRAAYFEFDLEALATLDLLESVLIVFGNRRKAEGFVLGAKKVHAEGYEAFRNRIMREGMDALVELPGIGPITKKHLARNIGLADVAKDDVWLVRIAKIVEAPSVEDLALHLSRKFDDGAGVVDLVLWKFCAESGWQDLEGGILLTIVSELQGNRFSHRKRTCLTSQ